MQQAAVIFLLAALALGAQGLSFYACSRGDPCHHFVNGSSQICFDSSTWCKPTVVEAGEEFVGTCEPITAVGAACSNARECGSSAYCFGGVCTAPGTVPLGSACTTSTADPLCVANTFCDNTTGLCAALLGNGSACSSGFQCESGNCKSSVCVPALAENETCYFSSSNIMNCADGLHCSRLNNKCIPLVGLGGACSTTSEFSTSSDCEAGLVCNRTSILSANGVCSPPLSDGDSCKDDVACASGFCSNSYGICYTPGNLGDTCDYSNPCVEGLVCKSAVCTEPAKEGEACTSAQYCVDGLVCLSDVCTPPGGLGDACDYNTGTCQYGLVCNKSSVCTDEIYVGELGDSCSYAAYGMDCKYGTTCISGKCSAPLAIGAECTPSSFDPCSSNGGFCRWCALDQAYRCYTRPADLRDIGEYCSVTLKSVGSASCLTGICRSKHCDSHSHCAECAQFNETTCGKYPLTSGCVWSQLSQTCVEENAYYYQAWRAEDECWWYHPETPNACNRLRIITTAMSHDASASECAGVTPTTISSNDDDGASGSDDDDGASGSDDDASGGGGGGGGTTNPSSDDNTAAAAGAAASCVAVVSAAVFSQLASQW